MKRPVGSLLMGIFRRQTQRVSIITVVYENGRIRTEPETAIIKTGDGVEWQFQSQVDISKIRWTVYFDHGSPFRDSKHFFSANTSKFNRELPERLRRIEHYGTSETEIAVEEGDYKYGVRNEDASSKEVLADDDPVLIVVK